jgi:hypothetical protein
LLRTWRVARNVLAFLILTEPNCILLRMSFRNYVLNLNNTGQLDSSVIQRFDGLCIQAVVYQFYALEVVHLRQTPGMWTHAFIIYSKMLTLLTTVGNPRWLVFPSYVSEIEQRYVSFHMSSVAYYSTALSYQFLSYVVQSFKSSFRSAYSWGIFHFICGP